MAGRSLLQSIREKELETSINLDAARREAAEVVEAATRDAAGILEKARQEAAMAAGEYLRQELEQAAREVEATRAGELDRVQKAARAEKGQVDRAVEMITRAVVPE
jgi:vacuolar-type H+-ATPase subunit H